MPHILTTFLLIFGLISFAQDIQIDTLFLPKIENNSYAQGHLLKYPIIKTGNLNIDKALNTDLKNKFTQNNFPDLPIDSSIIKWAENIIYLSFEVTYVKNDVISLNINVESCGAYCRNAVDYFTYNYKTGEYVTINQIIDTTKNLKNRVLAERSAQYAQQKNELKTMWIEYNEVDEDSYHWALEQYENCERNFTLNSFALYSNHLEIIDECYLPNAIKNLTPTITLRYKYNDLKKDLKLNYR